MILQYTVGKNNMKPIVHYWFREGRERKHKMDKNFRPYMYIPFDAKITDKRVVEVQDKGYKSIFGEKVKKVYVRIPKDVRDIKEKLESQGIKTYEADVVFVNRFLIDKVPEIEKEDMRILFIDIETDDREGLPDPTKALQKILLISTYDSYLKKYVTFTLKNSKPLPKVGKQIHFYDSEKDLINNFIKYFLEVNPDILTGWNVISFDTSYILGRMERLNIDFNQLSPIGYVRRDYGLKISGRVVFDLLTAFRNIHGSGIKSYALNAVSLKYLGAGKTEHMGGKVWQTWEQDLGKLIKYNINDVELCVKLNEKFGLLSFYDELVRTVGCTWEDLNSPAKMIDILVLRLCKDKFVLPTKSPSVDSSFKGATVFKPPKGIFENVACCDVRAMYPSIVRNFNISPECISNDGISLGKVKVFRKDQFAVKEVFISMDKRGIIPQLFDKLFKLRKEYKDLMKKYPVESDEYKIYYNKQFSLKSIINAIYGVLGFSRFRLYTPELGAIVTSLGRRILTEIRDIAEREGFKIIYGDTDGVWCQKEGATKEDYKKLVDEINKGISKMDIIKKDKSPISIELDKIYKNIFFSKAKKRYAGLIKYVDGHPVEPYLEIVGFEFRRSDTPDVVENLQNEVFKMILNGVDRKEITKKVKESVDYIKKRHDKWEEISIPKSIAKSSFKKYKVNCPHVRGSLYANKHLGMGINPGDKIYMIYIKHCGRFPRTDVLCFKSGFFVPEDFKPDWDRMTKSLLSSIERIFDALGWGLSLENRQVTEWL